MAAKLGLVGLPNAGKSTLFNALTGSGVWVEDRLFSTLDPTVRRFVLSNKQKILFIDTVGFLHRLPHHLIDAFGATLEEAAAADLLLHVLDVSDPRSPKLAESVLEVLKTLGADKRPRLTVLNKMDKVGEGSNARDPSALARLRMTELDSGIPVSALHKKGLIELMKKIEKLFESRRRTFEFVLPLEKQIDKTQAILERIYQEGEVLERQDGAHGLYIKVNLPSPIGEQISTQLERVLKTTQT